MHNEHFYVLNVAFEEIRALIIEPTSPSSLLLCGVWNSVFQCAKSSTLRSEVRENRASKLLLLLYETSTNIS